MDIEGLDYNTQREPLLMPEYGREIQKMVDYAVTLPSKQERQLHKKLHRYIRLYKPHGSSPSHE